MKPYFIKTPKIIKSIFKNWVWDISSVENIIYLTFDDGPTPKITDWTLEVLEEYQAEATFFCIGKNIVEFPDIYQRIIERGHSVGNHTQTHVNGWKTKTTHYLDELTNCANQIRKRSPENMTDVKLFRPPYGKLLLSQGRRIRKNGYKIIMWDVLSADFDKVVTKDKCLQNVLKNSHNGSIIVFHDSLKASEKLQYVLPKVLEYFKDKGYTFKKLS